VIGNGRALVLLTKFAMQFWTKLQKCVWTPYWADSFSNCFRLSALSSSIIEIRMSYVFYT